MVRLILLCGVLFLVWHWYFYRVLEESVLHALVEHRSHLGGR